jgi:adenylate cyclase
MKRLFLPIAFKLVFFTSLLVVGVATSIAWKNSELFSQISSDREEANVEMLTASKSLEVEAILESYVEKMSLLAAGNRQKALNGDLMYFKFENLADSGEFELQQVGTEEEHAAFRELVQGFAAESASIQSGKIFLTSTGAALKEPYLLLGAPLATDNGAVSHWAWGLFRLNRLQSSFSKAKNLQIYLLDEQGRVIVHPDEQMTLSAQDLSGEKIVASTRRETIRQRQQYLDETLFSSSRTIYGPMIIAAVPQESILAPSQLAAETSYFILGVILSISFFLSVVFSQTISSNLEKLTALAYKVAAGDFAFKATAEIRSKDEIGILAHAFDDMTEGLRERDKIKGMFTKFHGTTITEELLSQEDMRKGKQCEAVVFFSDIRGFTDFSNERSPEEVVSMLNSYFEVMVGIINRHGGVVDKFVGDAIMAIWGAPNGTPEDCKKAVEACLEMRRALEVFNEARIQSGEAPIRMGMGLHAGPVVAGTVGSSERLEYTVIGDTVNTASRIEAATKSHGTDLLISEEVLLRLDDQYLVRAAGSTVVKGKTKPLRLAKVDGFYDEHGVAQIVATPYSNFEAEESEKVKVVA